ncbi:YeiH family protein [Desulfosporosinus meridiei]|uniref:Putative membrane protein n=1 Tax=Desulfosporosinus meridiei (strain ATCC BAA-275 / DSM 13257 / KCTC 12902 / NCIMB 13706 / S10) TaxID=768704 RepID=J7IZ98_DESMD|nr:putative sulfate exporter family transporter [Desulfosporosinus meridiei]AFQ45449.1 putative membrane protein [Desulfosporosinus meridiei DSM 13257]
MNESTASKWIKVLPGLLFMFVIALLAMGTKTLGGEWAGLEGWIKTNSKFLGDVLKINHVIIVIIIGMVIRNTIGIPSWAQAGVKTSRIFIKMGVILLGSLYSLAELATLGSTSILLIATFMFSTIIFTMWLGKKYNMDPGSAACLAAGAGVCGVSAIVAVAPAVKARGEDIAYSIATILSFGIVCLFTFPILGHLMGLTPEQFGMWAGTGILNSGQVLAAALAFDPGTADVPSISLKVGEIYNLTRVVFLPLVVLLITILYARMSDDKTVETAASAGKTFFSKFPLFVLGFIATVTLTSFGAFGPTHPVSPDLKAFRDIYSWFFSIGLTGLGLQISFAEMRKAGGTPLVIGSVAGFLKAALSLVVVLWLF